MYILKGQTMSTIAEMNQAYTTRLQELEAENKILKQQLKIRNESPCNNELHNKLREQIKEQRINSFAEYSDTPDWTIDTFLDKLETLLGCENKGFLDCLERVIDMKEYNEMNNLYSPDSFDQAPEWEDMLEEAINNSDYVISLNNDLDEFKQLIIDCCPEGCTGTHEELIQYINSLENNNKLIKERFKELFDGYDELRKEVLKMDVR